MFSRPTDQQTNRIIKYTDFQSDRLKQGGKNDDQHGQQKRFSLVLAQNTQNKGNS